MQPCRAPTSTARRAHRCKWSPSAAPIPGTERFTNITKTITGHRIAGRIIATIPVTPIPSFHYSRYGGAVGGPLIPKEVLGGKTYFFFNYEGFDSPTPRPSLGTSLRPRCR